jgi:uncharacterized protein (DUF39 family)
MAAVHIDDIDTVAQILKFSLRELQEPIITQASYQRLMDITQKLKQVNMYS